MSSTQVPDYFRPNTIYCGDCLDILRKFPEKIADLIYLDPPFFSNRQYEILWGDGYEIRAFKDRWKGGIQNYIAWMEPKLQEVHRVLKETGSVYLHCDWHATDYLKVLMDGIFGNRLINNIIWKRTSAHSGSGTVRKFGTIHDNILFYSKSDDYIFNPQYLPYEEEFIKKYYNKKDPDGRMWTSSDLMASGIRHGDSGKTWRGIDPNERGNHWKFTVQRLDELVKEGRIYFPKKPGGVPRYKRYLDEMKGVLLQDIWIDIPPISAHSKERLGYPTQKPEKLLERIIKSSSQKDHLVLDPFCGCGTAVAVAHKLGRRWIGIDVSPTACKLIGERMRTKVKARDIHMIGMPMSIEDLRTLEPFEFQNWVIQRLYGRISQRKVGDMGIDGYTFEGDPVQVKQSANVGRNVVDNFETALRRAKKKRGLIVAFSFGKGAYEEIARAKLHDELDIEALKVEELIKNRRNKNPNTSD